MSRLTPGLLVLDKGLDLQTAKIVSPEGSLLDSINYEQVDFQGQKRIDGYARYDGSVVPALDDFWVVDGAVAGVNSIVFNGDNAYGIYLGLAGSLPAVAVFNETYLPSEAIRGVEYYTDAAQHYNKLLEFNEVLRSRIEELPGSVPGLHWFRDRLYAVADVTVLLTEPDAEDLMSNDLITAGGNTYVVLDSYTYGDEAAVLVSGFPSGALSFTSPRLGRSFTVNTVTSGIKASFFESRTEQQVLDEGTPYDFGWRFKNIGWAIPFINGNSPYGRFTSLNENRQGVGTQGPTPISDENGRPLSLTQKVNITNGSAQVYGWKTSTSPTVYNLESDALKFSSDDYYIYADAFFYWEADSSVAVAPGANGQSLIEYPATNTVPVEEI